uniref:ZP domain-containing protein n=1 Tax=Parascaris univalens TaxID=6257 RepID=A0A915BC92_PARUN
MFKSTNTATFTFERCNINRKREVNPRGMAYSLTVIVQLHPLFITKVDHAYNVRCFYMETNKEVNAELGVSDLTTYALESGHAMPQCSYTLHRDSPNGPVLRYARVGDIVYHVWDCPSDVYAMLVHTCFILDGQGGEHRVIDSNGCSTDDFIIPQLTYSNELTRSFTGASVVNLPDRESVYFSCQIKLCYKTGGYCKNVTPPHCDTARSTEEHTIEEVLDSEQLIATTAALPATSNSVKFISPITSHTETTTLAPSTEKEASSSSSYRPYIITSAAPMSTTTISNDTGDFPTPDSLLDYVENSNRATRAKFLHAETMEDTEGSGESDSSKVKTPKPSAERRRRNPPDDEINLLDVDVSTPQLNIIDQDFDFPDLPVEPKAMKTRRESVCIPVIGVWFISGISIVSITTAIGAMYHLRFSRRKLFTIY